MSQIVVTYLRFEVFKIWKVVSVLVATFSHFIHRILVMFSYNHDVFPLPKFVEPTGKRFLLAVDVSYSMHCAVMGSRTITARMASTAMAMVTGMRDSISAVWELVGEQLVYIHSCAHLQVLLISFSKNWEAERDPGLLRQVGAHQYWSSHSPRGCCFHSRQGEQIWR